MYFKPNDIKKDGKINDIIKSGQNTVQVAKGANGAKRPKESQMEISTARPLPSTHSVSEKFRFPQKSGTMRKRVLKELMQKN